MMRIPNNKLLLILFALAAAQFRISEFAAAQAADKSGRMALTSTIISPASNPEPIPPGRQERPTLNTGGSLSWRHDEITRAITGRTTQLNMTVDEVVFGFLRHSAQLRVLSDTPLVKQIAIAEEQSQFDARTFMESKFLNTNDPVGSTLTTGGAGRFLDQNYFSAAGVRQRTPTGGQFEVSQRIGTEAQNSIYFIPSQQGTSRLSMSLTQPLMNGGGQAYNNSLIILAEIDSDIAGAQFSANLQDLLLEVYRRYWELYLQRAVLVVRKNLYLQAQAIHSDLDGRRDVDVMGSQLVRAAAAVATREAATIRYATAVRNAESKLRALTNDPALNELELVPVQEPVCGYFKVSLEQSLIDALQRRPEIDAAAKDLRAAAVRVSMGKNELKPVLNAVLMTYMSGLNGNYAIGQSLGDQFSHRPTYSAGVLYELPWGNRAANARLLERQIIVRQLTNQLEATTANIRSEVEIAVREVEATYGEMASKQRAIGAEEREIDYLTERWRLLAGDQQLAGVVLDNILAAQERLAEAECDFATSLVAYNLSLIQLQRVIGRLLEYESVGQRDLCQNGLPVRRFVQAGRSSGATGTSKASPTGVAKGPATPAQQTRNTRIERLPQVR